MLDDPVGPVDDAHEVRPDVPPILQVSVPDGVAPPVVAVTVAVNVAVSPTAGAGPLLTTFVGVDFVIVSPEDPAFGPDTVFPLFSIVAKNPAVALCVVLALKVPVTELVIPLKVNTDAVVVVVVHVLPSVTVTTLNVADALKAQPVPPNPLTIATVGDATTEKSVGSVTVMFCPVAAARATPDLTLTCQVLVTPVDKESGVNETVVGDVVATAQAGKANTNSDDKTMSIEVKSFVIF